MAEIVHEQDISQPGYCGYISEVFLTNWRQKQEREQPSDHTHSKREELPFKGTVPIRPPLLKTFSHCHRGAEHMNIWGIPNYVHIVAGPFNVETWRQKAGETDYDEWC